MTISAIEIVVSKDICACTVVALKLLFIPEFSIVIHMNDVPLKNIVASSLHN